MDLTPLGWIGSLNRSRLFWFTAGYFLGYGLFELGRRFSW